MRSQLLLPLALLLLGVAGISVWTALASARSARRQVEERLRSVARYLSEGERLDYPLTKKILRELQPLSGAHFILYPGEEEEAGRGPIASFDGAPPARPPPAPLHDDWRALRLGPRLRVDGRDYRCSAVRLHQGRNAGDTLYILYPESLWRDALWEAVWPSLVLGGSLGLASVLLALSVGGRLGRRVGELERRTRQIAGGDFSPMPLPRRDDELRDLARSVNEMAQQLAQLQKAVQQTERLRLLGQVSGGLAHQLRNGVTGARLAVQLQLREQAGAGDTSALDVALRQLTLVEAHLKRFLDLGRAGALRREPCSLTALVGEAVELLRPRCQHAGIRLLWQSPDGPRPLTGDPGQLGQVLLNVLGNAVEAAGPGGEVEARLVPGAVEVWDSGPGPAPEVAERLFEPFVTGKPEGVGLGLATARQVVEAHGGRITWARADGRTCFRIELPAAAG